LLAKVLYNFDILSLLTKNVNSPAKNVNPLIRPIFTEGNKNIVDQYVTKHTPQDDVKG
jgi:hypothetical protein